MNMDFFKDIPFSDPAQAEQVMCGILDAGREEIASSLSGSLKNCPDPLRALVGISRLLERAGDGQRHVSLMAENPKYTEMLATLFSQSRMLTDTLCRNPEYAPWLFNDAPLRQTRTREATIGELAAAVAEAADFPKKCVALRKAARREQLRIAAREIWIHAPFYSIAEDLSNLADAALEAGIEMARGQLAPRFGVPVTTDGKDAGQNTKYVVLGMGKLGGRELNFSSDIDLVFVYGDNGKTTGGTSGSITNEEYFKKFGELVIKAVSEPMPEGMVFRVDMRLRPFGKSGALATPFDGALDYYITYGRAWERQALIKARPCAGDLDMGEALLEKLRPFVFPRYFDDATLEDIRSVKQQTEAVIADSGRTDREVKLGRGGIRDIEFTVQMLQLLNGGRWPDLRTKNTLEAIEALGNRQSLSPFEAGALSRHYVFLRQVEHRLQIEGGLQTHALPEQPADLDDLARRLGYADGDSFMRVYRERTNDTRRILEKFLSVKGSGNLWINELLDPKSTDLSGLEKLREHGFKNPGQARGELLLLANGPEDAPYTRDVSQQFAAVTPTLLSALSGVPNPDNTLLRVGQVLARLHAPATLYGLLAYNTELCRYLVTLIANSDYLSGILVRDVGLLDLVGSPSALTMPTSRQSLEEDFAALRMAAHPEAAPYRLRDGEMLKVAMRDLIQGISVYEVGDELTVLAEVILSNALQNARRMVEGRHGKSGRRFAILALGKLGGREMGYGSDLDLVFVHEEEGPHDCGLSDTEYFPAIASHTLKSIKEPTRYGILYDIDTRLRPDGSKGVLSITDRRLVQYYTEEAQPWERFALMKGRCVAGDPDFMEQVEAAARDAAFSMTLTADMLAHLESLGAKLAASAGELDLKRHQGGLSEVEFTTRYWQLRHCSAHPELKRGGVFKALETISAKGLESPEDCATLTEAYAFYRGILNRIRMMNGSSQSSLPADGDARDQLARRLGMEGDILGLVNKMRARVHAIHTRVLGEELGRCGAS